MPLALNAMIFRGLWTVVDIILQKSKHSFSYDLFFFCRNAWELCHNLLHHSEGKLHVHFINIYIFCLHWLTWGLIRDLLSMVYGRLLLLVLRRLLLMLLLFRAAQSCSERTNERSIGCWVVGDEWSPWRVWVYRPQVLRFGFPNIASTPPPTVPLSLLRTVA
jgi:hypothetical protein